jgi:hypothetical protein
MLGVVLNRAETGADETAYYYQQKRYQVLSEAEAEPEFEVADDSRQLEMIYIDEDVVS